MNSEETWSSIRLFLFVVTKSSARQSLRGFDEMIGHGFIQLMFAPTQCNYIAYLEQNGQIIFANVLGIKSSCDVVVFVLKF